MATIDQTEDHTGKQESRPGDAKRNVEYAYLVPLGRARWDVVHREVCHCCHGCHAGDGEDGGLGALRMCEREE